MAAKAVLGISPGTRIVGLAVIRDNELVEWKVKTFKETWSKNKRKAILQTIDRLSVCHGVRVVCIKKVDLLRSSRQLDALIAAIARQAERKHIKVLHYSLDDLDYDLRSGKRQTKDDVTEHVANTHPEVKHEYNRERTNRREYYTKMFEAIAMAEQYRGL